MIGIRVAPPTRMTSSICWGINSASRNARITDPANRSTSGEQRSDTISRYKLLDDQIHQTSGDDDLLDDCFSVDKRLNSFIS